MSYPKVFQTSPTVINVEKGKSYAWCTCGISVKNPLCDGSHKTIEGEPGFKSLKFTAEEDGELWLCNCKQSKNPPFCDGSHKTLSV